MLSNKTISVNLVVLNTLALPHHTNDTPAHAHANRVVPHLDWLFSDTADN